MVRVTKFAHHEPQASTSDGRLVEVLRDLPLEARPREPANDQRSFPFPMVFRDGDGVADLLLYLCEQRLGLGKVARPEARSYRRRKEPKGEAGILFCLPLGIKSPVESEPGF